MSVPLHVIHSESSTSPQKTEAPPVYELRGRARDERDGRSSNSSYTVRTSHGNTAVDDEYQRREKRYNGHSVRNHSNTTFEEEHGVGQESFNGYPAGSNGSVVLDYEDFVSDVILLSALLNQATAGSFASGMQFQQLRMIVLSCLSVVFYNCFGNATRLGICSSYLSLVRALIVLVICVQC